MASVHRKEGMWRPPSLLSSPLVTVILSLKNEEGIYASRSQYQKSCLGPVPFPKYVVYITQAELFSTISFILSWGTRNLLVYLNLFRVSQFLGKKTNKWKRPSGLAFLLMELWCQPGLHDTLGHKISWESSVCPHTLNVICNSNNTHPSDDLQPSINCRLLWFCIASLHPWNGVWPCWPRPEVLDHNCVPVDSDASLHLWSLISTFYLQPS